MSNETIDKVLRIMELAMLINPTSTRKGNTGNKPTVTIRFGGNCATLDVTIITEGWEPDYNIDTDAEYYRMNFDFGVGESKKNVDKVIGRLEEIYKDVLEGKYNDAV